MNLKKTTEKYLCMILSDTSQFDSLDEETKEWIATIGLKNAYASRDDGLAKINTESFVGPPSFETNLSPRRLSLSSRGG